MRYKERKNSFRKISLALVLAILFFAFGTFEAQAVEATPVQREKEGTTSLSLTVRPGPLSVSEAGQPLDLRGNPNLGFIVSTVVLPDGTINTSVC